MFLARVEGTVVSPVQHPVLDGRRLLLVRPVDAWGRPRGRARVAIDHARAGVGERVLVIDEGNAARQLLGLREAPVKTVVVGIVDSVAVDGRTCYDHRWDGEDAPRAQPREDR